MHAYIEQVGIENFKVFQEKIYFDFTKINVLIGTNSSGKSSLIKAFYLMQKCFSNGTIRDILDIEEVLSVLGDFSKLPNKNSQTSVISFYLPIVLRGMPDIMELKISYSLVPNSINQGKLTEISITSQKKSNSNDDNNGLIYSVSKNIVTNVCVNKIDFKFFIEEYQRELKQIGQYTEQLETLESKFIKTDGNEPIGRLTRTNRQGVKENYIIHNTTDAFQTSHPYYYQFKRSLEQKAILNDSRLHLNYRPFFDKYPGFFNEKYFGNLANIYNYAKSQEATKGSFSKEIIKLNNNKESSISYDRKILFKLEQCFLEKFIFNLEMSSFNQDLSLPRFIDLQTYLWGTVFPNDSHVLLGNLREGDYLGSQLYNSLLWQSSWFLKANNFSINLKELELPVITDFFDFLEDNHNLWNITENESEIFENEQIKINVRFNANFFNYFILENIEYSIKEAISKFDNCYFLGSYRNQVQRAYTFKEGAEFQQLLKNILVADGKDRNKRIVNRIKKYLTLFDIAWKFKIEREKEGQGLYIYLWEIGQKEKILLADLGYGISQILPLIFKIISVALEPGDNKKLFIEEPESNLHPALQSKLAELFADAVAHFDIQFFIETHSEYFVRRLQVLTANTYAQYNKDGRFPQLHIEDTTIYYFNHPDKLKQKNIKDNAIVNFNYPDKLKLKEEQIYKINIEKDGALTKSFGKGFFDESSKLNIALYQFSKANKN